MAYISMFFSATHVSRVPSNSVRRCTAGNLSFYKAPALVTKRLAVAKHTYGVYDRRKEECLT